MWRERTARLLRCVLAIDFRLHRRKIDGSVVDADIDRDDVSAVDAVRITRREARACSVKAKATLALAKAQGSSRLKLTDDRLHAQ